MTAPPNVTPTPNPAISSEVVRGEGGRFVTTSGRKPGSKNRLSSEMLTNIKAMGPDAVNKLRDALNDKDSTSHWKALELILRYCLPPARTVELDDAEPATVMQAFIEGLLTAEETKAIATAMEKLKNVTDINEMRERLTELEKMLARH
ncbi:hypothetical protein [Bradyrhizobium sp. 17]|uniref:hypothetical protein n=1 Tax=Bradyrhizobium sp. 17 TaxID=2782649 RepID=UPI001FFB7A14|nr:hypothetical protein [Bradyrhizobium sp. 17]MCK1524748.1 hypothetical protein [Bradyrhizobium sp. 17]